MHYLDKHYPDRRATRIPHKLLCETQLITTIDDVTYSLSKSKHIYADFLDFAKSFDRLPHQRLLEPK